MKIITFFVRLFFTITGYLMVSYSVVQAAPFNTTETHAITIVDQLRTRTGGDAGLSRLDETTIGIATALPAWQGTQDGQLRLGISHVTLNAGTPAANAQLGTSGSLPAPAQDRQGTALQLEILPTRYIYLQLGTTPLGYAIEDVTGAVFWRHDQGAHQFKIGVEHRAVTDSVLSYAGTHDPGTGQLWGGVRQSRLRMAWSTGFAGWGLYAGGGVSRFSGHHVADNRNWEGSVGSYHLPLTHPAATVVLATNITAFGYHHNQSLFTYGQGGYFSPQTFRRTGISASIEGQQGNFSYFMQADLGWQKVREDNAPWFPLDPSLGKQTSGASTNQQLGSSGRISGEYAFSKNGSVGLSATINRVSTFNENTVQAYLRYWFADIKKPLFTPPRPILGRDLFNE